MDQAIGGGNLPSSFICLNLLMTLNGFEDLVDTFLLSPV